MKYILTYHDANNSKQIRFFKTLLEAKRYMKLLREQGSNLFYDFQLKMVKPY